METVDAAAVRLPRDLATELVERSVALARGEQRWSSRSAHLPRGVTVGLRRLERRARLVSGRLGETAAFDFLGDAVALATIEQWLAPGDASELVADAANVLAVPAYAARFLIFRRAMASKECMQLPAAAAAELAASLLVELTPAAAASLWTLDARDATTCLVAQGKAPRSRGIREVARAALDGVLPSSGQIHAQLVDRWDRPYAALVVRTRSGDPAHVERYLAEAAAALAPILERAADVDRALENERHAVAAGERRLVRLGADLHDGPLQEIVAFAEELRLASTQIEGIVAADDEQRVRGRFEDLHARLASLDEALREIARSTRSTTAAARPVEDALACELQALERAVPIATELECKGDFGGLTNSQKIVLFRVVQEALSNVRKHSGASGVTVVLRSTRRVLDLAISDDGCGFDPGAIDGDRLGLAGLAERVRLLGGVVEIESEPGAGTTVRAILPQWRPSTRALVPA